MTAASAFQPDWVSPPGATILDLLEERGSTVGEFATAAQRSIQEVSALLYGSDALNEAWAQQLSSLIGASPTFWLRREQQYRSNLQRLAQSTDDVGAQSWLSELPIADMVKFGWIEKGKNKGETLANALAFFGVPSVESWRSHYRLALESAAYRTSAAFETRPGAVAAWLRRGEVAARSIDCKPWNREKFKAALEPIRALTREPDPSRFLPELTALGRECGVAIVVERAPDGCRASGATKFLSTSKALMLLSFRYLSDDQFWFTVFHEAGHLLLHSRQGLFLEGFESPEGSAEREADDFAMRTLFTDSGLKQLESVSLNQFSIARLAKRLGIGIGPVVGQLQEMGRIQYNHFNYMKVRYKWQA